MPGNEALASDLAELTCGQIGKLEVRRFPDGESYVRVDSEVKDAEVFLVCTLARPDPQFLPLMFAAATLRWLGARSVELIAPYLPYLRQDAIFHPGEGLTSRTFSDLLQQRFDRLVTVDPHLHRYSSLSEVYGIPTMVVHTGELIGTWVRDNVENPVVLGPDGESAQWVEEVARNAGCPWAVFHKERRGDRDVRLTPPSLDTYRDRTPVLVDDIISSGATMLDAAKLLLASGLRPPCCIVVHALISDEVATELRGITRTLLSTDTIPNRYSRLEIAPLIARKLASTAGI